MITGIMRLMWFLCCLLAFSGVFSSTTMAAADAKPAQPSYTNEELLTRMLVVDASEQVLDAVPALAVTFSQDLDPKASFDTYFTVTQGGKAVKGGWVMATHPRRLYFSAIEPDLEYRIQIRPGISSRSGLQLKQSADFTLKTRSITPVYDFATRGSILPVRLTGGLPVRVINVPELDVEFLRVKPDQLQQVLKTLSLDQSISNWQLDEIHAVSESVFTNRYVTGARHNARETLLLPVESIEALKAPGVYFAIMRQPGRFAENAYRITHFLVTNVGLHARLYAGRLEVFAHALDSGKAIPGVALTLAGEKETLTATTDADGVAAFEQRPEGALLLTALQEGEGGFAFLDLRQPALDLSEYAVSGRTDQAVKPFIYSPRDLYRPGESVDLSILLRNRDGLPEAIRSLDLQVLRPDAKLLGEYTLGTRYEELGYFEHSVKIPADAPTGLWRAELRLGKQDKQVLGSLAFHVEDFMPERMKLSLSTDDTLLSRGEKLVISARGDYLYGAPAAGDRLAAVRTLALDRHPLSELADFYFGNPADQSLLQPEELPEKKLDESGATFLELPALSDAIGSPLKITVTASLSEPGGRVVTRSLDERFWPVQNLVGIRPLFRHDRTESDAEARFEVVRANADGVLQAGEKLSATLVREEHEYYWEYNDQEGWKRQEVRNEYPVTRQPLTLAAGQKGEVAFKVGYGRYRLEVEDGDTQLKAVYAFSAGWVGDDGGQATRPDQIELKLDKAAYREGDTARLTIRPPAAGEAVVAVESDHLLWSQPLSLPPAGTEVEIPLGTGSDWARHDLYVSVVSFRPADSNQKIAPNRALGLLHLPLDRSDRRMELSISAPEKALPEKPVTVSVQAKGLEGQKAILTLSAVDAGVLNITRFKTPDPFGYYFDREAYDVDIHDDYGRIIESVDGRVLSQRFGGDAPVGLAGGALARADVQIVSLFRGAVAFDPEGKADIEVNVHATA